MTFHNWVHKLSDNVTVTTKEQTLVDCLDNPAHAGGIEEAIRSISMFTYLDTTTLLEIIKYHSAATAARIDWLLEEKKENWRVPSSVLESLKMRLENGPYRMGRSGTDGGGWSKTWKLVLPESREEVLSWIMKDL